MDYKEALAYLDSIGYFGSKPGLERIGALLEKLGNPQKQLRFIHIAGTKGQLRGDGSLDPQGRGL